LGKAAHAGGAPHAGVNALNAAMLAMSAINANRETFRDEEHIRVHPIITKGGELVNVVPAEVCLETFVRGASVDAITAAAEKVDRALRAGAMGVGAAVEITTLPGYLPRIVSDAFLDAYRRNAEALVGAESFWSSEFGAGSTDMGDLSHVMPAIEAQAAAAGGTGHGKDYHIVDEDCAYILPAKAAVACIIDLLAGSARGAREVIEHYDAPMTRAGYLEFMRGLYGEERWSEGN
jgi:metal-dependent amidase/aminoacylase/carboxypeptidase family protein